MYSGVGLLLRWWCWFCGGGVGIRGNLPFLQVVLLFPRRWLRWCAFGRGKTLNGRGNREKREIVDGNANGRENSVWP